MASAWYPNGLKHFALGDVVWKNSGGSDIKVALIYVSNYTYNAAHEYMATGTVPANSIVAMTTNLTLTDAAAGGKLVAANPTCNSVTGSAIGAIIVFKDGGNGGTGTGTTTDFLLAYIEVSSLTPNGGNITVSWDGTNGVGSI